MFECNLDFSPSSSSESGSYKLIELTADLATSIENSLDNNLRLTIKGHANDDAVLCTEDRTFTMRSIVLSNTVLVVTPIPDNAASNSIDSAVVIRDQLNEIIELVPIVPKLHKLSAMIRDRQYDEGEDEDDTRDDENRTRFTYQDALNEIQASEKELERGMKEKRILILHNELRPIAPAYLARLLELILNLVVSQSMKHDAAPIEDLISTLANEHEVPRAVSEQIIGWFGNTKDGKWNMDILAIVKEIGLGILRNYRHEPIEENILLGRWKTQVGDTFGSSVTLELLIGNYIETDVLGSSAINLKYFPASALPVNPAARFAELFLTRPRWSADEITPFLSDIAVNSKERDKFLLKYCRAISNTQGVMYTARAQYNG